MTGGPVSLTRLLLLVNGELVIGCHDVSILLDLAISKSVIYFLGCTPWYYICHNMHIGMVIVRVLIAVALRRPRCMYTQLSYSISIVGPYSCSESCREGLFVRSIPPQIAGGRQFAGNCNIIIIIILGLCYHFSPLWRNPSLGTRNARGDSLINFAVRHQLKIMNTMFKKSPQSKHADQEKSVQWVCAPGDEL